MTTLVRAKGGKWDPMPTCPDCLLSMSQSKTSDWVCRTPGCMVIHVNYTPQGAIRRVVRESMPYVKVKPDDR